MKRLVVVGVAFLLIAFLFACSVDVIDTSSNISEDIADNESVALVVREESLIGSSEETSSQHEHFFAEATCTEPKTCDCGETEGFPLEHDWEKATCETLKTCSLCGKNDGEYAEHTWKVATCKEPKTCSVCGKTEGNALEHEWKDATCTKASTCKLCGKTTGEPKTHTYNNGKCSFCGEKDPNYTTSEQMVWIPTKGGKKYHSKSSCSNMDGPIYVTISEAKQKGFSACKKCY